MKLRLNNLSYNSKKKQKNNPGHLMPLKEKPHSRIYTCNDMGTEFVSYYHIKLE